jgi:hypothetical protein
MKLHVLTLKTMLYSSYDAKPLPVSAQRKYTAWQADVPMKRRDMNSFQESADCQVACTRPCSFRGEGVKGAPVPVVGEQESQWRCQRGV